MSLFSESEFQRIRERVSKASRHIIITFRHKHGPTQLLELWKQHLQSLGINGKCINWWSSSGTLGLIECETDNGRMIFGQWALGEKNELIEIFEVDDDEIVNVKEGFDAGNVSSFVMRAIRIGETGED